MLVVSGNIMSAIVGGVGVGGTGVWSTALGAEVGSAGEGDALSILEVTSLDIVVGPDMLSVSEVVRGLVKLDAMPTGLICEVNTIQTMPPPSNTPPIIKNPASTYRLGFLPAVWVGLIVNPQ